MEGIEIEQEQYEIGSIPDALSVIRRQMKYNFTPITLAGSIKNLRDFNGGKNDFNNNFNNVIHHFYYSLDTDIKRHVFTMAMLTVDNTFFLDRIKNRECDIFYSIPNFELSILSYLNLQCPNETDVLNTCLKGINFNQLSRYFDINSMKHVFIACHNTNRYDILCRIIENPLFHDIINYLRNEEQFRSQIFNLIHSYSLLTATIEHYEHEHETDRFPTLYLLNVFFNFGFSNRRISDFINVFTGRTQTLKQNLEETLNGDNIGTIDHMVNYIKTEFFRTSDRTNNIIDILNNN